MAAGAIPRPRTRVPPRAAVLAAALTCLRCIVSPPMDKISYDRISRDLPQLIPRSLRAGIGGSVPCDVFSKPDSLQTMPGRPAGVNLVRCLVAVVLAVVLVEDIVGYVAVDGRVRKRVRAAVTVVYAAALITGPVEVDQAAVNGQVAAVVVVDTAAVVAGIPGDAVTGQGYVVIIVVDRAAVLARIPRERAAGQLHVVLVADGAAVIITIIARGVLLEGAAVYGRVTVVVDGAALVVGVVPDEVGAGDRQAVVALDGAAVVVAVVVGEDAALNGEVPAVVIDGAAVVVVGTAAVLEVHVDDGEVNVAGGGEEREAGCPAVAQEFGVEADDRQVHRNVGQGLVQAVDAPSRQDDGLTADGGGDRRGERAGVAGHVHGDRRLGHGRRRGSEAEDQGPAHGSGPCRGPYLFAMHLSPPLIRSHDRISRDLPQLIPRSLRREMGGAYHTAV